MKAVFFDLDGTLTDSAPGITRGIQYAFDKMGYPKYSQAELRTFIGPPLNSQFRDFAGMNEEQIAQAVKYFREKYESSGKFESRLYPGIKEMLEELKDAGMTLGMATSKPEHFAVQIADHFGLTPCFDYIVGATMDESKVTKKDIITEILKKSGFDGHREDAVMVGDRKYDIEGASAAGIASAGVTYGFGTEQELREAGAPVIVGSVEELTGYLLRWGKN